MTQFASRVGTVLVALLLITSVIAVTVAAVDEGEVNDSEALATPVTPGEQVEGEITPGDEDWFRVDAATGEEIVVTLTKPSGLSTALALELREGSSRVDSITVQAAAVEGTVADTASGPTTYFVRVSPVGASTTSYTLDVSLRAPDAFEPNDNRKQSTPLEPGVPVDTVLTANDEDVYSFDLEPGEEVTVTLTITDGVNTRTDLVLSDPDDQVNSETLSGATSTGVVSHTSGTSATYYVEVSASQGSRYNYTLELAVRQTVGTEPNENRKQAVLVESDDPIEGEISASTLRFRGDNDWYKFDVVAGQAVEITVTKEIGPDTSLNVWLYDPDGRVDSASLSDSQSTVRLDDVPEVDTTYYVQLFGQSDTRATYTLTAPATATPPEDDDDGGVIDPNAVPELEPNDDFGTAMAVSNGSVVAGSLDEADVDTYSLVLTAADELTVTVDRNTNGSVSMVVVSGPSGEWVTATVVGSGAPVVVETTAESSGLYHVQVVYVSGRESEYQLDVLVDSPLPPVEP